MAKITPVPYKLLICVFQRAGYLAVRQEGSHIAMTRQGSPRPLVIPAHQEVSVGVIASNLRSAQIGRETYFRLLDECG